MPDAATRHVRVACHRFGVEAAATKLGMGPLWPLERRLRTLNLVRTLPTYDRATDTVEVCWHVR